MSEPTCGTCGGTREIEGRAGTYDAPRVDCPECVTPRKRTPVPCLYCKGSGKGDGLLGECWFCKGSSFLK